MKINPKLPLINCLLFIAYIHWTRSEIGCSLYRRIVNFFYFNNIGGSFYRSGNVSAGTYVETKDSGLWRQSVFALLAQDIKTTSLSNRK